MATLKIRHLVIKPGKAGTTRCFWQPSAKLRKLGWTGFALKDADGNFLGLPAAMAAAEAQNAKLDAWRQGEGVPGTPGQPVAAGSVQALIDAYTASPRFTGLAADTRKGYLVLLKVIAQWAGDAPMAAITPGRVQTLYEQLYPRTPSRANHLITMIRTLFAHAVRAGWVAKNPAEKPGLMGTGARAAVWSDRAMDALMDTARAIGRPSVAVGVMMAAHLAQRPTDVRLMLRSSYGGGRFTFHQSKTGELIQVRALPELAAALDDYLPTHNHATILVNEATGLPYSENAWSHAFRHTRAKAMELHPDVADELARLQFRDFRRTGVVRLAEAGATVPEVAAVSGHSIDATTRIMETYLPRTTKMADQAITKLETARANRAKAKGE